MISDFKDIRDVIKQLNLGDSIGKYSEEASQSFLDCIVQESDRAVTIIVGCLLGSALEKLIRAYYVKEKQVGDLFRNDHILQSFLLR